LSEHEFRRVLSVARRRCRRRVAGFSTVRVPIQTYRRGTHRLLPAAED